MRKLEDYDIIQSVLKGNAADYNLLINRYKHKAYSLCLRITKNDMDAEEVLQDCFLKAYNNLKDFRRESSFSTWFYRIVYNTALTKVSSKQRKIDNSSVSIDKAQFFSDTSTLSELADKQKKEALNKAIGMLPSKQAAVITLFYLEEMSTEEIAGALEMTVSNVKVILHRGRNALRAVVFEHKLEEELQ